MPKPITINKKSLEDKATKIYTDIKTTINKLNELDCAYIVDHEDDEEQYVDLTRCINRLYEALDELEVYANESVWVRSTPDYEDIEEAFKELNVEE